MLSKAQEFVDRYGFLPLGAAAFWAWRAELKEHSQPGFLASDFVEIGRKLASRLAEAGFDPHEGLACVSLAGFYVAYAWAQTMLDEDEFENMVRLGMAEWRLFESIPLAKAIELWGLPIYDEYFWNKDKVENELGFAGVIALNYRAWSRFLFEKFSPEEGSQVLAKAASVLSPIYPIEHLASLWAVASLELQTEEITKEQLRNMVSAWLRSECAPLEGGEPWSRSRLC